MNRNFPKIITGIILILLTIFIGCGIGPKWEPDISFEEPIESTEGKHIIVSQFLFSQQQVSYTSSPNIIKILESARVQDISLRITKGLIEEGVSAEALKDISVKQLKSDQLLLKGAVIVTPLNFITSDLAAILLSFTTIGCILPTPLVVHTGAEVYYRYELVDHMGRILQQTGDKHTQVTYKHHYTWGLTRRDQDKLAELSLNKIAKELGDILSR